MKKLCIVIPCYNEEDVLPLTIQIFEQYMQTVIAKRLISDQSRIVLVNDGSTDCTWSIIRKASENSELFIGVHLAKNVGHQNALIAGLFEYMHDFDIFISIDADLQDDITTIEKMLDAHYQGYDIVYAVRSSRQHDTFFKRETAQFFYRIMVWLGTEVIYNHADFRLMSSRAVIALSHYKERNLFLRGIVPMIGYPTTEVYYERQERVAGHSKYSFKKMLHLAFEGVTSLSVKPIRAIVLLGISIMILSAFAMIYIFCSYQKGTASDGWASIMVSIWFLGGLQLFSIGIIGLYLGKVYIEVKERPRYEIEEVVMCEQKNRK